jgi:hypothetical protein
MEKETYLLDAIEAEMRAYNKKLQGINVNPYVEDYNNKVSKIRIDLNEKLEKILLEFTKKA